MLTQRLLNEGRILFRYRSYLPLIILLPFWWELGSFHYLLDSEEVEDFWLLGCLAVSVLGLMVRVTTVGYVPAGTSGRNTVVQKADSLNQTGWYSVCRNPLYLGNFLIGFGFALALHAPSLLLAYLSVFWLYYERIVAAEESFLAQKFGRQYTAWVSATPIFLPAFHLWRKPSLGFCWRTVLRREYSALLLIGIMFFLLDLSEQYSVERRVKIDPLFLSILLFSTLAYVTLRTMKKHSALLDVAGRN